MPELHIVILAAGKGTRMKSARPKVLHRVAGLPMIEHVLATAATLAPRSTTVVVGHEAAAVESALKGRAGLSFVVQEPQLGTAHALLTSEPVLRNEAGTLVLLSGDVPLLSAGTLMRLRERHDSTGAAATVVTARLENPYGYGRIVRSGEQIARIVEEKDATPAEREIREINSGIYAFALRGLFDAIRSVAAQNVQKEYYLTDLVEIFRTQGQAVETVVSNPDEIRGINSRRELAEVSRIVRQQKHVELMDAGVTIEDPDTAYIDRDVVIGPDTIIHPGVSIEGRTTIGSRCEIHSGVRIISSQIGSKSMHLAYLRDAIIGEKVNIGAGTITCNYDGTVKNKTIIDDGAFIGSDTQLVAPVTIGAGAYVGSGTTVRENVPAKALAVSAGKQRNIEGWVDKKKQKKPDNTPVTR